MKTETSLKSITNYILRESEDDFTDHKSFVVMVKKSSVNTGRKRHLPKKRRWKTRKNQD